MTVTSITPQLGERQNELNQHKFDQLKHYTVRDLDCGIEARVHPRADEISRLTHEWLRETDQHTLFDEATFQRFVDMDCPRVLSMTHPDSPFEGTLWIAKLVTMLFVADDYLEVQVGEHAPNTPDRLMIEWNLILIWSFPDDSENWIAKLLGLFHKLPDYRKSIEELCRKTVAEARKQPFGTQYPEMVNPCAAGFLDLWQEAITVMPKQWSLRQGAMYNDYFCWHIRESIYRKEKKVPTNDEYVIHRSGSGGMQMLLGPGADFVDKNFQISSDEIYFSETVQHLLLVSNLGSCLFNDIYSFPKELRNGEYHNMVFLVSYWRQCSYNEAVEVVMGMVEDINQDIKATCEEITKLVSPEERRALEPTIQACINSIPAHNVFHKTSYRYSFNKPLVVVV
ncbi:unnamed protein product [Calypogeia fissa]